MFLTERDLGKPKYDIDRTDPLENNYTPVSSVTNISSGHYPVPTLSSTITVIAPAHHGNNTTESWSEFHEEQLDHNSYGRPPLPKKRCRDYDGKSVLLLPATVIGPFLKKKEEVISLSPLRLSFLYYTILECKLYLIFY